MSVTTSFTFSDDFKAILDSTAREHGKTKTSLIMEAVKAYSSGNVTEPELMSKIEELVVSNKKLSNEVEQIKTLCIQILANQHNEK